MPALHRLRRYLRSAGRYGTSPFLVGHYGSSGEIAQGFCRTAAVSGAVYILGRDISSLSSSSPSPPKHILRLADFPDPLSCSLLISSPSYSPPYATATPVLPPPSSSAPFSAFSSNYTVARCIAIIDCPLSLGVPATPSTDDGAADSDPTDEDPVASDSAPALLLAPVLDTAVLVFPPGSLSNGGSSTAAATVLLTGEGTMSCPKGKCASILHSSSFIVFFSSFIFLHFCLPTESDIQGSSTSPSRSHRLQTTPTRSQTRRRC